VADRINCGDELVAIDDRVIVDTCISAAGIGQLIHAQVKRNTDDTNSNNEPTHKVIVVLSLARHTPPLRVNITGLQQQQQQQQSAVQPPIVPPKPVKRTEENSDVQSIVNDSNNISDKRINQSPPNNTQPDSLLSTSIISTASTQEHFTKTPPNVEVARKKKTNHAALTNMVVSCFYFASRNFCELIKKY
jgi:hypothetical protein